MTTERPEVAAWAVLVDALRDAGERLARDTEPLDEVERADAYRSLLRAMGNQLGRYDADHPRHAKGAHRYRPEDFAIDPGALREHMADYERYRIDLT